MNALYKNHESGFTIIEVGIVVPMLMAVALGLAGTLFFTLRVGETSRVQADSAYDIQEALSIIEKDTAIAAKFLSTKDDDITDAYPPSSNGGAWSYIGQGTTQRALLLQSYATTTNPDASDRQPVFLDDLGCGVDDIFYNNIETYNTFYFISNNNLYRRRALGPSANTCSAPYQFQSCPSLETLGTASRDASCQSNDELILRDISEFSIDYYQSSVDTSPLDVYTDDTGPELVQTANAAKITIATTRKAMGSDTTTSSTLFIPRINVVKTSN